MTESEYAMNYQEDRLQTKQQKTDYLNGIKKIIEQKNKEASEERAKYAKGIFDNPDAYRKEFRKMLGWPLDNFEKRNRPKAEEVCLLQDDRCEIYRMSIEVIDELKIYGLFFKHKNKNCPLVIAQHGAMGSPELAAGFYENNTYNYNDMIMRIFNSGVNVFAPQTLTWFFNGSDNGYGVEADRIKLDGELKRIGSSIAAIEIFAIMRIADYFENCPFTQSIGMAGLSYGGFFTLFTAACDTRIKAAISCSFFNERHKYSWTDWTWKNAAYMFGDAEIACLIYPRKLWIGVGKNDEAFEYESAKREFERLKGMCSKTGIDWLGFAEEDAGHEFCISDEIISDFSRYLKNIEKGDGIL